MVVDHPSMILEESNQAASPKVSPFMSTTAIRRVERSSDAVNLKQKLRKKLNEIHHANFLSNYTQPPAKDPQPEHLP